MKKNLLKIMWLIAATLMCLHVHAQRRIKNNYATDEGTSTIQLQKNTAQTFLQSSLSGYYFEGFEGTFPPAGWQVIDVLDTSYVWSNQTGADYPATYEGAYSAYMHYNIDGGAGGEDWFITPKFMVSAGDSLSFWFKFEYMGYPPDSTFILVSQTDSSIANFEDVLDFIVDSTTVPGAVNPQWTYKSYSLNSYVGQEIYIAFKNKNILGDGVFIDNVEIGTRPAAEVSAQSIEIDKFYAAGVSNPIATVKNRGSNAQTFNVTMDITGGYSSTKSVTLAPQASTQVSFDPWNAAVGNYTLTVQTLLPGDADPSNDTLSVSTKVLEPFVNYGWSTHDALAAPVVGAAATSVCSNTNSRIFLTGGVNGAFLADAYEYDLSFATWAGINPMPVAAGYPASAVGNGRIFVFAGGTDFNTGNPDPNGTTRIYDYTTDTWTIGAPMPTSVANAGFATYNDSLVYIIGGNTGSGIGTTQVQVYNMYTDAWSSGTAKPGDPIYGDRAGIARNKIVVTGGYSSTTGVRVGTTYVGEIDTLNPSSITWTQVADYPATIVSRAGSGVSLDKNSGLVIFSGGVNSAGPAVSARTFAFDVNSSSWKLGPDKITALELFYMTPVLQNDSIYLAALGGDDGYNLTDKNEWLNLGHYHIPTGIAENTLIADATIFPNPASIATTLSLNLRSASQVKVSITDVTGKTIIQVCDKKLNAGNNVVSLPVASLSNGLYFCVISVDGTTFTKKIIVR